MAFGSFYETLFLLIFSFKTALSFDPFLVPLELLPRDRLASPSMEVFLVLEFETLEFVLLEESFPAFEEVYEF